MSVRKVNRVHQFRQRNLDILYIRRNIVSVVAAYIKKHNPCITGYTVRGYKNPPEVIMGYNRNREYPAADRHRMSKKILLDTLTAMHNLTLEDYPTTCSMKFPVCDIELNNEYAMVTVIPMSTDLYLDRINDMYRLLQHRLDNRCMYIISLYLAPYDYNRKGMIGPTEDGIWQYDETLYRINQKLSKFSWGNKFMVNMQDPDDDKCLLCPSDSNRSMGIG